MTIPAGRRVVPEARHRSDSPGPEPRLSHQGALDGLRGLAVAAVVLFHSGLRGFDGGFLGVEAFFVLSGYLITTLLLEESRNSGTIRLGRFWARRARRLLPALLLLVVVVAAYQALAGTTHAVPDLVGDGLSTLFYVANWHQIWTGAGYFAATGPTSPLQHTWSLAIEEQFYLVWPLVILALCRRARRRRDGESAVLNGVLVIAATGTVLSAAAMAFLVGRDGINRVYFGTDTRASGILAGAVVAVVLCHWRASRWRLPVRTTAVLGTTGLILLLAGVIGVSGDDLWLYRGGFLLVDLAVAALILGVSIVPRSLPGRALSLAPLRALGIISYGVYLWHFPLFLWLTEPSTGLSGAALLGVRIGATLAAATLSYFVVEKPIRSGRLPRPVLVAAAPVGAAIAVASVLFASLLVPVPVTTASAATPSGSAAATATGCSGRSDGPSTNGRTLTRCAPRSVLLVGDSIGYTLGMGLGADPGSTGITVVDRAILGCGFTNVGQGLTASGFLGIAPACVDAFGTWRHEFRELHPVAVVVVLGYWDCFTRQVHGEVVHVGERSYDAYLTRRMGQLIGDLGSGSVPIVLVGVPLTDAPPLPDGTPAPENDVARHRAMNSLLRDAAAAHPGVSYFDLDAVISPQGRFTSTVSGQPCRWSDGIHITVFCGRLTQHALFPVIDRLTTGAPAAAIR